MNENDKIVQLISKGKLEDLHPFKQNLIKEFNIDYNTYEGFKDLSDKCSNSIFLNFYADAQFVIIKSYYQHNENREISDEELVERICKMKLHFWYKIFKYPLTQLGSYERAIIYHDFDILRRLYERGVFVPSEAMEYILLESINFDFDSVADKYTSILNIQSKSKYDKLGLESYINDTVPSLLEMEPVPTLSLINKQ